MSEKIAIIKRLILEGEFNRYELEEMVDFAADLQEQKEEDDLEWCEESDG